MQGEKRARNVKKKSPGEMCPSREQQKKSNNKMKMIDSDHVRIVLSIKENRRTNRTGITNSFSKETN